MRVFFISNLYPPYEVGGWEQNCQEIALRLPARGHACHVLTSRYGVRGRLPPEADVTRALHLEADMHHYRPLDFFLRRPWQERANRRALRAAAGHVSTGCHLHLGDVEPLQPGRLLGRAMAAGADRVLRRRLLADGTGRPPGVLAATGAPALGQGAHGAGPKAGAVPPGTGENRRIRSRWNRSPACSEYVRRKLTAAGALPNVGRVIYNGIDPRPFLEAAAAPTPCHDGLHLVYTGGILAHKGVHTAVEALGLLHQRGEADGVQLTLVGGGHPDYMTQLQRRVEQLALGRHVVFHGRVPRDQIARILAAHDVFLFTSVYEEPIARTVMEAMAAGLTVIGTNVGGQAEMLEDGVNGLVYPLMTRPGWPTASCGCGVTRNCARRLAAAGRKTVLERFTLDRMADETEAWLESISP